MLLFVCTETPGSKPVKQEQSHKHVILPTTVSVSVHSVDDENRFLLDVACDTWIIEHCVIRESRIGTLSPHLRFCSGQLRFHREMRIFLSLHWNSLLWNPQTAAACVNEPLHQISSEQYCVVQIWNRPFLNNCQSWIICMPAYLWQKRILSADKRIKNGGIKYWRFAKYLYSGLSAWM